MMSGSNSSVFLMTDLYFALSSSRSITMNAELYTRCIPSVRTKYPSINQNASASSSVPGTSAATRSTTSRQNSCGMCWSNSAWLMPYSALDGIAPLEPGPGNHSR